MKYFTYLILIMFFISCKKNISEEKKQQLLYDQSIEIKKSIQIDERTIILLEDKNINQLSMEFKAFAKEFSEVTKSNLSKVRINCVLKTDLASDKYLSYTYFNGNTYELVQVPLHLANTIEKKFVCYSPEYRNSLEPFKEKITLPFILKRKTILLEFINLK